MLLGSYAGGDYDEESDIDLMVTLNDETVGTIDEVYGHAIPPWPVAGKKCPFIRKPAGKGYSYE